MHIWFKLQNLQVLGQLNHRCGMTSQTRSLRMCPSAIRKLIRSSICMRTVVFDARCVQALYLLNIVCDLKHVTVLFVNFVCPTHRYANDQISVVTTPVDPSRVYHCKLLFNVFTIIIYIYIVVPRINGFLCKQEIRIVPLSCCGP